MKCPKCGKSFAKDVKFCSNCGFSFVNLKNDVESTKELDFVSLRKVAKKKSSFKRETKPINSGLAVVFLSLGAFVLIGLVLTISYKMNDGKNFLTENEFMSFCSTRTNIKMCRDLYRKEEEEFYPTDKSEFFLFVENEINSNSVTSNKCNDISYQTIANNYKSNLNIYFNSFCSVDKSLMNDLLVRLNNFKNRYPTDKRLVDVIEFGKETGFSANVLFSSDNYHALVKKINLGDEFKDYDKLKKSYAIKMNDGYYVKNSVAQDLVTGEMISALNYYLTAQNYKLDDLVIDDYVNYSKFLKSVEREEYSKNVVEVALSNINLLRKQNNREEISLNEARKTISKRSMESYTNTFEDAILDSFINGSNASTLSQEINRLVLLDLSK